MRRSSNLSKIHSLCAPLGGPAAGRIAFYKQGIFRHHPKLNAR